jgi:hypothetical protein
MVRQQAACQRKEEINQEILDGDRKENEAAKSLY